MTLAEGHVIDEHFIVEKYEAVKRRLAIALILFLCIMLGAMAGMGPGKVAVAASPSALDKS